MTSTTATLTAAPGAPPGRTAAPPPPIGTLRQDLAASVVVFLVALPLCLGVALASGAPLMSGIVAGIIGGLIVAPISGSALMVSGPAAGLTAIVLAAILELGSFSAFLAAVVVAGLLQIGLGVLKAGQIGYYFPNAVVRGMLSAIGLILILKQLPHALGYDADAMGDSSFLQRNAENTFTALAHTLRAFKPTAAAIGIASIAMLGAWARFARGRVKMIPGALVVVLLGILINAIVGAVAPGYALTTDALVSLPVPRSIGEGAAAFTFPSFGALGNPVVWRVAFTIAIVASLETLLSVEATDRLDPWKRLTPSNRELVAQGVGNTLSGLVGGLPITGVIVRSAANVTAGGSTKRSAIAHGALLLVAVALLPAALNLIPLAALAAILIVTGWKLAHPSQLRAAWQMGRDTFVPFVVTIVTVLLTDLLIGIAAGLAASAFFILKAHLSAPGFTEISQPGAVLRRLELDDHVTFLSKARFTALFTDLPEGSRLEIDGRHCKWIDRDVLEILHDFTVTARSRGIDYRLVGVPALTGPVLAAH